MAFYHFVYVYTYMCVYICLTIIISLSFVWMWNSCNHLNIKNLIVLEVQIIALKNLLVVILDYIFFSSVSLVCIFILIKHYFKTKLFLQCLASMSQHLQYFVSKLLKTGNSSKLAFSCEKDVNVYFSKK